MAVRFQLEGIYTPVITPFHADLTPDWDALAQLVDRLLRAGVHGLIAGGSTGEAYAETVQERIDLARFVIEQAKGQLPVFLGTGAMRTPDSLALAAGAKAMGADGLLLGTPPYSVPTERENALNALAIDTAADLPIILYNYPGRMSVEMGRDFLDIVGQSKNFIGIKESSGDINRLHLLAHDYPNIQMSCGMDDQALEFFAWGARSWICAGSNFLPEEHIYLYETCVLQGDFAKGRRIMSAMLPLMRVLEQGGKFIQCVKHGVEVSGLKSGPMRPPLQGLSDDEKHELEQVIQTLKAKIAAIRKGA